MKRKKTETPKKKFMAEFDKLCKARDIWEVWADLISSMACFISNTADYNEHFESRKAECEERASRLGGTEVIKKFILIIGDAFEENPEQDFLGELYMEYNLGKHSNGQYFTPYSIAKFMSSLCGERTSDIKNNGFARITDPACGSGVMLIAAANLYHDSCNFQRDILFVGQDIDPIAAKMCYIQLSILGCAGYVCIGDTLKHPLVCDNVLFPVAREGQELWLTPMFMVGTAWNDRRKLHILKCMQVKLIKDIEKTA